MNADELKALTKLYIRDHLCYFDDQKEALAVEKKRIGVRKFKMDEYAPFLEWYSRSYTISAHIGTIREEQYDISLEEAMMMKDAIIANGVFPKYHKEGFCSSGGGFGGAKTAAKVFSVTIKQRNKITNEKIIIEETIINPV